MLTTSCPECSQKLKLPDDAIGKKVQCSACSHVFVIDDPDPVAALKPPPPLPQSEEGSPVFSALGRSRPRTRFKPQSPRAAGPRIGSGFGLIAASGVIALAIGLVGVSITEATGWMFFGFRIIGASGVLALAIGLVGMCIALGMETTVAVSNLGSTERVHNQGLMHNQQITLLASGTAVLSGILALGFAALSARATRTNWIIEQLATDFRDSPA
jgi:hypothetical protein